MHVFNLEAWETTISSGLHASPLINISGHVTWRHTCVISLWLELTQQLEKNVVFFGRVYQEVIEFY